MNGMTRLVLAGLATWRVTHLLAYEDGPGEAVVRLREAAGSGLAGQALDCFDCLSMWVAAPMTPYVVRRGGPATALVTWLALSSAACLAERLAGGTATVAFDNDKEDDDELLR